MRTEKAFIDLIRQATISLHGYNPNDPCCQDCIDLNEVVIEARRVRKYV